jgi:protein-tyrosine-phosphatase
MRYKVLFLGNGNSARSIMAEAILGHETGARFAAYSAGVQANRRVDAETLELLQRMHLAAPAAPKNWYELVGEGAPHFDFIVTVGEEAALLPRSMWPGRPIFAHWGLDDPARANGNAAQRQLAYADAFRLLTNRIRLFASLPLRALDRMTIARAVEDIGDAPVAAVA